jgi:UPF0716 protein FxsA
MLLLFILFPIAEIWTLMAVGSRWGYANVFFAFALSAVIGLGLAKAQGQFLLRKLQANLARGEMPPDAMMHSLLKFLSAVLFIVPGFLSDILAVLLLFPGSRHLFAWWIRKKMATGIGNGSFRVVGFGFGSRPDSSAPSRFRDVTPTQLSGTPELIDFENAEIIDVTPTRPKPPRK